MYGLLAGHLLTVCVCVSSGGGAVSLVHIQQEEARLASDNKAAARKAPKVCNSGVFVLLSVASSSVISCILCW